MWRKLAVTFTSRDYEVIYYLPVQVGNDKKIIITFSLIIRIYQR